MMTTTRSLAKFNQLRNAEDYFEFFELDYDPQVVNINRLHILRKFSQLVQTMDTQGLETDEQKLTIYRNALQMAYDLFLTSNSVQQKLFKVFQDKPKNVVMLSEIGLE